MNKEHRKDLQKAFDFFSNIDQNIHGEKIKDLTTRPTNLDLFEIRLIDFCLNLSPNIKVENEVFMQVVFKENILNILNYFEDRHCRCVKICFGLDEYFYPQALVSGSFVVEADTPTLDQVDTYYTNKMLSGQTEGVYFLNFDQRISPQLASEYISRYQEHAPLSDLHGYVLDIETYQYFLMDEAWLGKADKIHLRFGMNHSGAPDEPGAISGKAQIMTLEFAPNDKTSGKSFYFYILKVLDDDDETGCPPRQPCNPPVQSS